MIVSTGSRALTVALAAALLLPAGAAAQAWKVDSARAPAKPTVPESAAIAMSDRPGAPTLYYGDEVGMTGDDDPDNRRTYPWTDQGGAADAGLLSHYRTLAMLRRQNRIRCVHRNGKR